MSWVNLSRAPRLKQDYQKALKLSTWLIEKHIEGLDHYLQEITAKYHSEHRKQTWISQWTKKQSNRIFKDKNVAITVIMECRKTPANKFRTRLGFN